MRMLKLAAIALSLLPLASIADQMVVEGRAIKEGDPTYVLLKLAGKPQAVRYEKICLTNDCTETGNLERWTYVRNDARYIVGVFDNRVTSVIQKPTH